jgi:hypothetical protein
VLSTPPRYNGEQVKGRTGRSQRRRARLLLNAHPHDALIRVNHTLQTYPSRSGTAAIPTTGTLLERSAVFGQSLIACCSRGNGRSNDRTATMDTHARTDGSAFETLHVEVIIATTLSKRSAKSILAGVGRVLCVCFRSGGWFVHADNGC